MAVVDQPGSAAERGRGHDPLKDEETDALRADTDAAGHGGAAAPLDDPSDLAGGGLDDVRTRPTRDTAPASIGAGMLTLRWAPWLIALIVFVIYSALSIAQYLRLGTVSWDLGIFTEAIAHYAHLRAPIVDLRQPGLDILGDHVSPIIAVLAPFFRLFPSPITLLVAQAALVAVSVVPVTRLAARSCGTTAGYAIGIAYGFAWGLQNAIMFDFHEIAFAVPLLAISLGALVDGRHIRALLWSLPLLLVKEDQGFTVMAIGLIVAGGRHLVPRVRLIGLGVAVLGVAASLFCILWVVPHFNPAGSSPYWQVAGIRAPGSGQSTVAGIDQLVRQLLGHLSSKLPTLFLLVLPTAFVAPRSPLALVVIPSLIMRFAVPDPSYWGTAYHYNATAMPILFVAAIDAIRRLRAASPDVTTVLGRTLARHAPVAMLAIAIPLANQFALAQLWTPHATFAIPARTSAARRAMAVVPNGARVETTLDLLAPLATRTDTFWVGNVNPAPDYVVWDNDNSGWSPAPTNPLTFIEQRHNGVRYRQIYADSQGFYVFERVGLPLGAR